MKVFHVEKFKLIKTEQVYLKREREKDRIEKQGPAYFKIKFHEEIIQKMKGKVLLKR